MLTFIPTTSVIYCSITKFLQRTLVYYIPTLNSIASIAVDIGISTLGAKLKALRKGSSRLHPQIYQTDTKLIYD